MCGASVDLVFRMYVLFVGVGIMPESKRQCSKCQFFQNAQLSGNGWCTHPKRQLASDVKILVRERELACRNSWGDDLWVDANGPKAGALHPDAVTPPRKGLFTSNRQGDDEVTSVVDTAARQEPSPEAHASGNGDVDDIVTFTSVRREEAPAARPTPRPAAGDLNTPAIADQAERARLIARGSKDAIQKARERHSRRRKPERGTTTPEAATDASDRIIAAQDREHYAPAPALERSAEETYRTTPPVPREEVEANGNALSPASGSDGRFDSVAEVRPEVDLSQLRDFLNHSGPSRRTATADPAFAATTSFDLVLKQAQEIKAAGDLERDARRPAPASLPNRESAPRLSPRARPLPAMDRPQTGTRSTDGGVVWDVEGNRLSVAFERARFAIDAPIAPQARRIESPSPIDRHTGSDTIDSPPEDLFFDFDDDPNESPYSPVDVAYAHETGPHGVLDEAGYAEGLVAGQLDRVDDAWFDPEPDEFPDAVPARRESPRGSWWRSLNFGRKRRYRTEPVEEAWDAAEVREGSGRPFAVANDDRFDDVDRLDDGFDRAAGYDEGYDEAGEPELAFATSDESWAQDAWEFPEPQPAGWHEAREELLAFRAGPPPTERVPTGDVIDSTPGAGRARRGEEAFHYREVYAAPVKVESPSFAFDEPAGMHAFRTALFGADLPPMSDAQSVPPDLAGHGLEAPRQSVPAPTLPVESRSTPGDGHSGRTRHAAAGRSGDSVPSRSPRGSRFSPAHPAFDTEFDIRDALDDQDAIEDLHFDVASRVPKACSTCRSFRPTETGDRGWCMNDWSSTHRQMVNADDLACRSSIGDWWLATDTSWIPPTDVIQPSTPRTDRLVARSDGREATTRTGRRVRTSKVG